MIEKIHIIHLPHRVDREENFILQSKQQKFEYQVWPGITGNKRRCTNITQAFKQIVRWAKENNLSRVTIGEDDLAFTAPGAWQYYLSSMPAQYDIFSGGIYHAHLAPVGEYYRIMNGYSGNTLITVHQSFYDFFLSIFEEDHLDRRLGNYAFERMFLVCSPFVVKQMGGYSDNHLRDCSYEEYEKGFQYYGLST